MAENTQPDIHTELSGSDIPVTAGYNIHHEGPDGASGTIDRPIDLVESVPEVDLEDLVAQANENIAPAAAEVTNAIAETFTPLEENGASPEEIGLAKEKVDELITGYNSHVYAYNAQIKAIEPRSPEIQKIIDTPSGMPIEALEGFKKAADLNEQADLARVLGQAVPPQFADRKKEHIHSAEELEKESERVSIEAHNLRKNTLNTTKAQPAPESFTDEEKRLYDQAEREIGSLRRRKEAYAEDQNVKEYFDQKQTQKFDRREYNENIEPGPSKVLGRSSVSERITQQEHIPQTPTSEVEADGAHVDSLVNATDRMAGESGVYELKDEDPAAIAERQAIEEQYQRTKKITNKNYQDALIEYRARQAKNGGPSIPPKKPEATSEALLDEDGTYKLKDEVRAPGRKVERPETGAYEVKPFKAEVPQRPKRPEASMITPAEEIIPADQLEEIVPQEEMPEDLEFENVPPRPTPEELKREDMERELASLSDPRIRKPLDRLTDGVKNFFIDNIVRPAWAIRLPIESAGETMVRPLDKAERAITGLGRKIAIGFFGFLAKRQNEGWLTKRGSLIDLSAKYEDYNRALVHQRNELKRLELGKKQFEEKNKAKFSIADKAGYDAQVKQINEEIINLELQQKDIGSRLEYVTRVRNQHDTRRGQLIDNLFTSINPHIKPLQENLNRINSKVGLYDESIRKMDAKWKEAKAQLDQVDAEVAQNPRLKKLPSYQNRRAAALDVMARLDRVIKNRESDISTWIQRRSFAASRLTPWNTIVTKYQQVKDNKYDKSPTVNNSPQK
jgi:hypothetical protein